MMCPAKLANSFLDVLKNSDDLSIQRKLELLPPDMVDVYFPVAPFLIFFRSFVFSRRVALSDIVLMGPFPNQITEVDGGGGG